MDALRKLGSMRSRRRVSAAASAQAPEKLTEIAGTAAPLNNKEDMGDQVSNGVSDFVQDEASNGEFFLHGEEEEEEEEETEGEEDSTARLTPIRAPVSVDDDGGGGGGDGDVSSGSGESFDSALERMAASSTPSYEASPVGSYNAPSSSHILHNMMMMQEQEQEQQKGLGVGQQGALMRLNHMISGQSTLDTAVIENCTEEEFKHKMEEIARSKDLSLDDARISSIMDALLPLLPVHDQGGGSQTASESKPEYDERNVVLEEEDDKNKEDVDDASAPAAMPVAKLSAEDEDEEEELLIEGDQAFEEKGERPNGDEFVEANEGADEGEEDEETLFDNRKGNIIKGNLSRIISQESRDDDKTEEVATAQAATSEEKQSDFPADGVLPKELGSVLIAHEEPILQKGATRETKEEKDGDIEDKTEVLLVPQEESEECKETESNAEALAEKESATGGPSEEETLPSVVSETRFAQPKGEEDVAAAPKESSHIEAVEVGKEAPKPSPVVEDKSESEIGEDNSTVTVPINTEQAITMKEEEEEGVPEEVASEEADGLRAVENRAASESAIISKPPRGEVNTEEEESLLSAVPKQVSSRDVIEDCESVKTNSIVDSVTDKDGFDNQTTPELPIATEDFTTEEDRANKATTAVLLAAENDKTLDASDVDLSLPDTVKSVNPVTENGGAETAAVIEAKPKSAFLTELQDSNGDWVGEEEDKEEVNHEEEDGDEEEEEEEEEEERGNLDAAEALAALVKSARSESESRSENSKTPSLGAAGPSLPQRPTGRSRPTTAVEPPRNPPHSNVATASQLAAPPEDNPSNGDGNDGNDETREKLQNIRVKFLRLAHRLGQSPQNVVVAQVLYRLGLAEQLRGGQSASRAGAFSFDRANAIAEEQEAVSGQEEELDFACTVLLLGKTGVGKSATINSIFDEPRTSTNAFHPSTKTVQEIVGHVHGIKVRVIDTPGLLPSLMDQQHNERIMGSVKNYIRKSSPDIVLYFDRLDMQSRDYGDLPLLRTITDLFGAAIWFNAIVVLTHASSAPPDGPNGVPLSYEMFVAQRSHVVQQTIRQAAGDMRLMNPVSLVENHPACRTNRAGQRVLPNGQIWKPQLLLLCFASKILADANSLLKLQDTSPPGRPFGQRPRVPPLPFLLSSLLQSRAQLKVADEQMGDEDDADSDDESDVSDGDDYDELPPFRPLAKEELEELSKEQKQQYAEEVADRERLFQKKQWREELKRRKEMKQRAAAMSKEELAHAEEGVDDDGGRAAAVPVPMPDMALPPSFDSDNPTHRYRYLETANQWLVRPVLETHGWDHDAGYDGFNVEKLFVVADKIPASISGQVTKDKKESQVNFEAAASFKHGECKSTLAGFDIQTIGKDLGYTLRSETQFNNFKRNKTTAGLTFTLLGDTIAAGLKLEDRLLIGKRFKVVVNGGVLTGRGDKAFGGSLEATLRGKHYPLSRTLSTLGLSVMDWHGDLAIGGNLQSQFMVGKTMMVTRANLNNRGAGQVSIRASSSEQLQMVLIGIVPIFRSLINSRFGTAQPSQ